VVVSFIWPGISPDRACHICSTYVF